MLLYDFGWHECVSNSWCFCVFYLSWESFSFPHVAPCADTSLLVNFWSWESQIYIYVEVPVLIPYLEWLRAPGKQWSPIPSHKAYLCIDNQSVVIKAAASSTHQIIVLVFTFLFTSATFAFMSVELCILKYFCYSLSLF